MVIYLSVECLNSIGQSILELESRIKNADGQTKQTTNGQTNRWNYTKFKSNLEKMVIYLPVKFEFDWTKGFRVRARKWKC